MDSDAMIKAPELVMLGETFIPSAMVLAMLDELPQAHEAGPSMPSTLAFAHDTAMRDHNLSSREAEILRRLASL